MFPILQFTAGFPDSQTGLIAPSIAIPGFTVILVAVVLVSTVATIFIVRSVLHSLHKVQKAFDRVVLHVLVPKERKSEGSSNMQEDRLEHVKEEIGITETFFSTLAGLKPEHGLKAWFTGRNDHISFELVVHNNLINFYIGVPQKLKAFIEQQINAQYPYAHIEEITDYNIFGEHSSIVGAYLKGKTVAALPFKTYKKMDSDPLAGVLNTLARIREGNASAAIQYVVRVADKKWRKEGVHIVREVRKGKHFEDVIGGKNKLGNLLQSVGSEARRQVLNTQEDKKEKENYQPSGLEEEMMKGIEEKLIKGGLEVTMRVVSASDNPELASLNLDNIVNSFAQYNLYRYGNSLGAVVPKNPQSIIRSFIYRSFHEKRMTVVNTEEMAGFWHLPLHSTEAPNIKWLLARKAPPPPNLPHTGIDLGRVIYRGQEYPVKMKDEDRRRHLYVIGKSGSGKSVFIENMAVQDVINGKGVAVIDPHGDFAEYVLEHIPKERADDVVIFNPSDFERPIGLNMLEAKSEDEKDFVVQEMIAIFYKLFPPEMIGPMFEHNMRNVMLTLMADLDDPGTIIDIPRMFTDDAYVKKYLVKLKDPVVRAFWEKEMAKTSDFHKSEMLGYLISKVGRFVENEMMRNIMGQQKSGFDFRDIMDKQKILIVNLAKGKTGEVNAKLIGLIIVAKLQMAALGRADLPEEERKDFYLYIDEFQNFITDSIATILSEARKYRLDLIVAHQYLGQLMDEKGRSDIKDAVLGNAGTIASFRIGPEDSELMAKEFAPVFGPYDLMNVEKFTANIKLLIDNEPTKPFNMSTYPPTRGNKELGEAIRELSRLKYGRDRRIVEAEIMERTRLGESSENSKTDMIEASL
ncbi:MAG TPA: type IV secretion system DNA-binding domain-containing protein [Candidatus Magasanikbacteria bacterium]|nr:type IV secretion system DNA-binding domain-containing protein [Candidatus Magasanikbacteria bacterium]